MILSIDPGTIQSAYVIWDNKKKNIKEKGIVSNEDMLKLIENNEDTEIVIEMVACYGMPVGKTTFETVLWIGRFVQLAKKSTLVYRKDIKMYFCNTTRAKDSNVRQVLIDRFGETGTKKTPGKLYGVSKIFGVL
jgi:hypothetical protein